MSTAEVTLLGGRFELLGELGSGGMGTVHKAYDHQRQTRVAVKTMNHVDGDTLIRFKSEFRSVADVHHRNLVRLGELIEADGILFFTMELVEGCTWLDWVRPATVADADTLPAGLGGRYDDARLRDALAQLVDGLATVHDARRVHRDVKPSNVLVDRTGRVVLLDFGLAARTVEERQASDILAAGTAAYMAPEQAASQPVGPPADLYSVGVLLYQALTGQLPFDGTSLEILTAKLTREPPAADSLVSGLPDDLSTLSIELLRADPAARPNAADVLRRLGERAHVSAVAVRTNRLLIGRERELERLSAALRDSRSGGRCQLIVGPSGVGKTALLDRFVDSHARGTRSCVALFGRCHERESLPFNAFDGVVDGLCKRLARLSDAALDRVLPRHPGLLPLIFPAFARVPRLATLTASPDEAAPESRRRAFDAFRELVDRLAEDSAVVIAIDDLHRANQDSFDLLLHLMNPVDSPRILFVGSARPGVVVDALQAAAADGSGPTFDALTLPMLDTGTTLELARHAAARHGVTDPSRIEEIAAQSDGHPGFVMELARAGAIRSSRTIDQIIALRIARLSPAQRDLVQAVAIAGVPISLETLARVLDTQLGTIIATMDDMRELDLLASTGRHEDNTVEIYHDRIGESVARRTPTAVVRDYHARLAATLEAAGVDDPSRILRHRIAGGLAHGGRDIALRAAREARGRFELHRAADLYRIAVSQSDETDVDSIHEELGDVLASVGDNLGAATEYQSASGNRSTPEALVLRCRSAEALLLAGHVPECMATYAQLLEDLGAPFATSRLGKIARLAVHRLRARRSLRTWGPRRTPTSDEVGMMSVLSSVGSTLSTIDPLKGAEYQARFVSLAMRVGDDADIVRALSMEAAYSAMSGASGWNRARQLLTRADAVATSTGDVWLSGRVELVRSISSLIAGEFASSRAHADRAHELLGARQNASWERRTARIFGIWACYFAGDLRRFELRTRVALRTAEADGDRFSAAQLRMGACNALWLMADAPSEALAQGASAIKDWAPTTFQMPSYYDLVGRVQCALYEGDGLKAFGLVARDWPALEAALLLRIDFIGVDAWYLRGRAAVAAAAQAEAGRRPFLTEAERAVREIGSRTLPWRHGLASLVEAAVWHLRGDRRRSASFLENAEARFQKHDMAMHLAAARHMRARLNTESNPPTHVPNDDIRDPNRWYEMLAPGFRP